MSCTDPPVAAPRESSGCPSTCTRWRERSSCVGGALAGCGRGVAVTVAASVGIAAARVEGARLEDAGRIVGHAEGGAGVGRARQLLCGAVPPAQRQPEVAAVVAPEVNLDGAADRLAQRPLRLPVRRHPPAEPAGRAAQPHLGEGLCAGGRRVGGGRWVGDGALRRERPAARRARRGVCAMRLL